MKNTKVGDIFENKNGWQRRKVVAIVAGGAIYQCSYLDDGKWTEFVTRGWYNQCSIAHLNAWGKKVN
jgi:hypothetical protein